MRTMRAVGNAIVRKKLHHTQWHAMELSFSHYFTRLYHHCCKVARNSLKVRSKFLKSKNIQYDT